MQFFEPKETEYLKYKKYLSNNETTCENSYLNAIIWKDYYNYRYSLCGDSLVIRLSEGKNNIYFLPLGNDFQLAFDEILKAENGHPVFCVSEGERLDKFLHFYKGKYGLKPIPENFEYIYSKEALFNLSGKKYHQKRNHLSAFSRKYSWHYETMSEENICDVIKVSDLWLKERADILDESLLHENSAIKRALSYFKELQIVGGIIYVEDEPVAYSFGTALNDDVFDVNIEKALNEYQGAYSVINNEFVKNELENYSLVNREDDLGIEGLRKAKLSYYPEIILKKYLLEL